MDNGVDGWTGFTRRAIFVAPSTVILICNYQICKKGRLDDVWVCITIVLEPADEPGVGIVIVFRGAFDDVSVHYPPHGWINDIIVIDLWKRLD